MAGPDITSVGDALEGLVHQFADPWAFLRELIQNAIDAGSPEIDVGVEFDAGRGAMVLTIADHGEGMTREVIDTRLTRLFSSAKEGDYTKIGRFGIGFVSVFALDPAVVCVDTGRAGEYWRVVFRRDRGFERIRLGEPVEGTTVRLYVQPATEQDVAAARAKAAETLAYWCKHVRAEVRLDGEVVSGPMAIDGLCSVRHEVEGTEVVMALVRERAALRGYYHGGLTLHEERDESLPHIAFKVDSRFLEHTLTRDNVIRDEHYAKAMAIVGEVARTRLMAAVFERLERVAAGEEVEAEARALLYRSAAAVFAAGTVEPGWQGRAVVPVIGGEALSLAELRGRRRGRRLYRARAASPVCARLTTEGHVVIAGEAGDGLEALVVAALGETPVAVTTVCTALAIAAADQPGWAPLQQAIAGLLAATKWKVSGVAVGRLQYPDSPVADRVAITQARAGELTPVADIGALASGWLASGRTLVLSADHPTLRDLRDVAGREPELAAYLAIKSFFLHGELSPAQDAELAGLAAEARWRRTE